MKRIDGERICLRPLRREDIAWIHTWVNDPFVRRFLLEGYPQTRKETERFVQLQMEEADPLSRALAVARPGDLACIGVASCHNIDWRNRVGELGILIGELAFRGKGYGTEAVELTLTFGFNELNLHRVFLRVFDFNERAIRSYRKCGLVEEGRLREAYFEGGTYHDIVVMAILEQDYRARQQKSSAE